MAVDLSLRGWPDVAAIATCLQSIVVIIALLYARQQFKEADRNRRLTAMIELFRLIGEEELRQLRSWALGEDFRPLAIVDQTQATIQDKDAYHKARKLAVTYDRVGYMIEQDVLPLLPLLEFQRDEIERLWTLLKPVISYIRAVEARPNYCRHFELLAARARAS